MVFKRVLTSSQRVSLGSPLRVTGRELVAQKVILPVWDGSLRLIGRGSLYVSILDSDTEPIVKPVEAVTAAVHGSSIPVGLFSYTIENHAAISDISRANVPVQSDCMSGMSGQTRTPGQVASVLDTTESHSLA
jgi:hypothetical protein